MKNRFDKILRLQNVEKKLCKRSISNIDKIIELLDKWLKKVKRILQQIFRNVAEKMLQSACSKACSIRIIDTFIRRHISVDWITRFNGISGGNVRIRSEKRKMQRKREREIPLRMNIQSASSLISQAVDDHSAPCRDFLNADVDNHLRKNPRLCARFAGPQDNFTSWRGETKKPSLRFNHEPLFFSLSI